MSSTSRTPRILIAGATGFIGKKLLKELIADPEYQASQIVALQRHQAPPPELANSTNIVWRSCDLYSLLQIENACLKVDVAIYLVHSMLPSARLNQAHFQDTDLIMADNFARACKKNGVKRIIYLGGIIPEGPELSEHLKSRLEVEQTLGSYKIPFTGLRAAMILGSSGSSFEMMALLVKHLPLMIGPSWTAHRLQPIDVQDVVQSIKFILKKEPQQNEIWDLAGPETVSYQELMQRTAKVMKRKLTVIPVRFFSPRLSVLWIRLITGMSTRLIKPLVQSLRYDMLARKEKTLQVPGVPSLSLDDSIRKALDSGLTSSVAVVHHNIQAKVKKGANNVRSVQRLPLPKGKDAAWVAKEYARWLPRYFSHMVNVEMGTDIISFYLFTPKIAVLKLKLSLERSSKDRPLFYIVGGLLAGTRNPKDSRLEFREALNGRYILAAIHNFSPSMPWYIYKYTQALTHLFVMYMFGRHLAKYKD
jgi:uncharacterized protein YbjT (DUF2867 family)